MTWVFDSLLSWITKQVASALEGFVKMFLSVLGCDLTTFNTYFPYANKAYKYFIAFGLGLMFLIWLFQMVRVFWGPLGDAENPISLTIKSILFVPFVWFSGNIVVYVLKIASNPYDWLLNKVDATKNANLIGKGIDWGNFVSALTGIGLCGALVLIVLIMIGWNFIKILLEAAERYVLVGVLTFTAPVAVGTAASKSTSNIFKGWCRMVGSQVFLLIMNVWFLQMIVSAFSAVGLAVGLKSSFNNTNTILKGNGGLAMWLILVIAMEKTAQQIDSYMASMGMTVAKTGGSLLDDIAATAAGFKEVTSNLGGGKTGGGFSSGSGNVTSKAGTFGAAAQAFGSKFAPSSYATDSVSTGGQRQGIHSFAGSALAFGAGQAFKASLGHSGVRGKLATNTIGKIASGAVRNTGMLKDTANSTMASRSLAHFMPSMSPQGGSNGEHFTDVTIGGGEISGKVANKDGSGFKDFHMYDAAQHKAPTEGSYQTVSAANGSRWYLQYVSPASAAPQSGSQAQSHQASGSGNAWYKSVKPPEKIH